jgi:hypothetical protein
MKLSTYVAIGRTLFRETNMNGQDFLAGLAVAAVVGVIFIPFLFQTGEEDAPSAANGRILYQTRGLGEGDKACADCHPALHRFHLKTGCLETARALQSCGQEDRNKKRPFTRKEIRDLTAFVMTRRRARPKSLRMKGSQPADGEDPAAPMKSCTDCHPSFPPRMGESGPEHGRAG